MNKGIFIDLNGTLLNDKYQISKFDQKAIKKIIQNNYKVYLVTGQSLQHAYKFYQQLNLKTTIVTSAGQVISLGKKIKHIIYIDYQKFQKLIVEKTLQAIMNDFIIQTQNKIYVSDNQTPLIELFYEKNIQIHNYKFQLQLKPIGCYLHLKHIDKFYLWKIIDKIAKKYQDIFNFHPWEILKDILIIHVVPKNVNKQSAIKNIITKDKIDHIITFGNGRNDIPILKMADQSFAMKNSTEEVKCYATNVTEYDNNNSGVGKTLIKVLLNQS